MAFDQSTRNRLQRFVTEARTLLADEFTRQLQATYGMNPNTGEVADIDTLTGLTPHQQETAQLLRDTLSHYLANAEKGKEKAQRTAALGRIVREQAFTILNRLAALRMSEARGFLIESIAKGYESKGFQLFHRLAGTSLGETGAAYQHYVYSLFDEFSLDLAVLFDRFSVQGRLFPSHTKLLELLGLINHDEINLLWIEDETVGWIYQYFNSIEERRQMRAESQAPRNSRELAVRNQFFTPRYVVEFLTDNTLGRIWYEMTQGNTGLKTSCKYLVRRPNELFLAEHDTAPEQLENLDLSQEQLLQQTVYIDYRKLKDPRDIRMLDPACGSMHFGLYAFDLFEAIYSEAWDIEIAQGAEAFIREPGRIPLTTEYADKAEFLRHVPRLIIEHNIHGVDIDPRAAQIAGLSLWLRAHNSWQKSGIKPVNRPKIQRSNNVCAEPMPGEKALLQEFTASLKPTVLGQLVEVIFEKMELAGEAGSLLKIEEEIKNAIAEAKQTWQDENKGLFQFADFAKIAKQRGELDFDVSEINDEGFWEQAEQKILDALQEYAEKASTDDIGQRRLFSEDAAKGFAFIELCRKRFDVVLMNPPFGDASASSVGYLDKNYKDYNKNILCAFIIRAFKNLSKDVAVGAIYDKTALIKSTYERFRKGYLVSDSRLFAHIDLGWDVLDANVEVACSVFDTHQTSSREALFINVKNFNVDIKKDEIELAIGAIRSSIIQNNLILMDGKEFSSFPNAVLGYDFPLFARNAFKNMACLSDFSTLFEGHTLKSEVYFRYWFEVPESEVISSHNKWQRLYNGGAYQRYTSHLCDVICIGINSELVTSHNSTVLRNNSLQGKGVIGFGKRGQFVDTHVVPNGFISTVEGKHVVINEQISPFVILALLNSRIFQFLINLYCGQHKYPGYVSILPVPKLDNSETIVLAGKVCEEIFELTDSLQSSEEVSPKFGDKGYFNIWSKNFSVDVDQSLFEINRLENIMNIYLYESYGLSLDEREVVSNYCIDEPSLGGWWGTYIDQDVIHMRWSFLFGVLFGRWDVSKLGSERTKKIPHFSELPSNPPLLNIDNTKSQILTAKSNSFDLGKGILVLTGNDKNTGFLTQLDLIIESIKNEIQDHICFNEFFNKSRNLFKSKEIDGYFCDSKEFFNSHLSVYSKSSRQAPIYWLLQTPSSFYNIWVYYHRLDEQTLYTCVNDFVDKKIISIDKEISVLKSTTTRSNNDEKKFTYLSDHKFELEDFRNELLRIAKFWKPNLNDGVQITAAPLWRLFQHKPWQKKLKETWEQLEAGDYDWAHLAYSIWPDRVLRKCHKDRSLAIAHEVEQELWHEVQVIKGRSKNPVWEWQPKPLSEAELTAYIQSKIQA